MAVYSKEIAQAWESEGEGVAETREPRKVSREIPNRWIYTSFKELETGAYSQGSQPSAVKYIYPLQFHYPAAGVTVGHTIQASFIDTPTSTIYGRCL